MAMPPQKNTRLLKAIGWLAAGYVRLVNRTSKVVIEPENAELAAEREHPFIFALWHGQFMMLPALYQGRFPVAAMVARHGDAEIIGDVLSRFGMMLIRGAGAGTRKRDRGGATALRTSLRVLAGNTTLAMTAEVPPGPAREAGPGIVTLARMSGRPILPFAAATTRYISLPTWSRLTINLPFSRLAFVVGQPIRVPEDASEADLPHYQKLVSDELNRVTARAYELAGANMTRATPPARLTETSPPVPPGVLLSIYRRGTSLMRVIAPILLAVRKSQGKEDPQRINERYGIASQSRREGPLMWIHAASVGETLAVLPVLDKLANSRPDLNVLLTTGTVTSANLAGRRLRGNAVHQYVPLDTPEYVTRFLDHWKPDLAVFTESEIWPNLILTSRERGIPLVLVNGRMSGRSGKRWRRMKSISRPLFSSFSVMLAQNEGIARAYRDLGARKIEALGNLKIDCPPPPVDRQAFERLTEALAGRPVLLATSTHPGEDDIVAEAHARIVQRVAGLATIIAPRHPDRGATIADMLTAKGLRVRLRSKGELPTPDTEVYIADTIGELGTLYAAAKVSFIGGSLVPRGGQNPIEAIAHDTAVVTGPHWQNFADVYRALMRHHGVRQVATAEELANAATELLTDPEALAVARQGGKDAVRSLSGALDATLTHLEAYLPPAKTECHRVS